MKLCIHPWDIDRRIVELAGALCEDFDCEADNPIMVGVLTGASFFLRDLVKQMPIKMEIGYVKVKSYKGSERGPISEVIDLLDCPVKGRHIVIVEDIVDSGTTIDLVRSHFEKQEPASIKVVSLLMRERPDNYQRVDHFGFLLRHDSFVVGCGLDHDGAYRTYPGLYVI